MAHTAHTRDIPRHLALVTRMNCVSGPHGAETIRDSSWQTMTLPLPQSTDSRLKHPKSSFEKGLFTHPQLQPEWQAFGGRLIPGLRKGSSQNMGRGSHLCAPPWTSYSLPGPPRKELKHLSEPCIFATIAKENAHNSRGSGSRQVPLQSHRTM